MNENAEFLKQLFTSLSVKQGTCLWMSVMGGQMTPMTPCQLTLTLPRAWDGTLVSVAISSNLHRYLVSDHCVISYVYVSSLVV